MLDLDVLKNLECLNIRLLNVTQHHDNLHVLISENVRCLSIRTDAFSLDRITGNGKCLKNLQKLNIGTNLISCVLRSGFLSEEQIIQLISLRCGEIGNDDPRCSSLTSLSVIRCITIKSQMNVQSCFLDSQTKLQVLELPIGFSLWSLFRNVRLPCLHTLQLTTKFIPTQLQDDGGCIDIISVSMPVLKSLSIDAVLSHSIAQFPNLSQLRCLTSLKIYAPRLRCQSWENLKHLQNLESITLHALDVNYTIPQMRGIISLQISCLNAHTLRDFAFIHDQFPNLQQLSMRIGTEYYCTLGSVEYDFLNRLKKCRLFTEGGPGVKTEFPPNVQIIYKFPRFNTRKTAPFHCDGCYQ